MTTREKTNNKTLSIHTQIRNYEQGIPCQFLKSYSLLKNLKFFSVKFAAALLIDEHRS